MIYSPRFKITSERLLLVVNKLLEKEQFKMLLTLTGLYRGVPMAILVR